MNMHQHAFVCALLRHGNKSEAYQTAYRPKNENPRSIESAANRLLKNPEVYAAIAEAQERMLEEARQELKEKYVAQLLTVQRKRELLAQIAEGKWMEQPPPGHIEGQRIPVMVPTLKERLKAIDMDNRMDGSYRAPAQTPAADSEELPEPATVQNERPRQSPVQQKDTTELRIGQDRQTATKRPVQLPGAVYVPVTNNKIEKPAAEPRVVPLAPYLNTPQFFARHNKTQQPGMPDTIPIATWEAL